MSSAEPIKSWSQFFESHAVNYDQNPFTFNTVAEVDFLLSLFPLVKGMSILDIGCGTGRHSIELAKREFRVTGLDFSAAMLGKARDKASEAGVEIDWVEADATDFKLDRIYDAAICLCEGAVGLVETGIDAEAHDSAVFRNISAHLKPNAPFLLTAMNGYAIIRRMTEETVAEGTFDPTTMVAHYLDEFALPEGRVAKEVYERLFIAPELVRILKASGFHVDNVWGGTAGQWGQRPINLDEVEAMYVCRKA